MVSIWGSPRGYNEIYQVYMKRVASAAALMLNVWYGTITYNPHYTLE